VSTATNASAAETRLADTGSFDSTPYVIGGTLCLTLGAGFITYSVRRERLDF
jgi:LPXTG-motif cell wall-anchored protein